jgi:FAD/FMN-containing dehydrogenase
VLVDDDVRAPYEVDWTRRYRGSARCVVRPADTDEVAGVLRACAAAGAPVVAQGGNTGLVGGGVPRGGEVVLSLVRLTGLDPVDPVSAEVTAGAGVTLGRLQAHAREAGLEFGVDLAARDSATVGGMVATNAGGVHALRYGSMRAQVVGLRAVLSDGRVLERMPGLVKDNTGYDLPGLLVGSEGTLAVVTAARLRLRPLHPARVVAVLAVAGTTGALAILARLRSALPSLNAAEIFYADGLALVRNHTGVAAPFGVDHPAYLLVECAAHQDPTDDLVAVLAGATGVLDAAVATDGPGRERLWALRERHTEAISAEGIPHKLDISVPLDRLAEFEARVRPAVAAVLPEGRVFLFGHLGDGNIHVNALGADPDDGRVDDAVLQLVADLGGSISAEHGIGVAKVRWLGLTRSPVDVAAMAAVKRALDPAGLLNPGVLFDR